MPRKILYFVRISPDQNGEHVVHRKDCKALPPHRDRHDIGRLSSCAEAVSASRSTLYPESVALPPLLLATR